MRKKGMLKRAAALGMTVLLAAGMMAGCGKKDGGAADASAKTDEGGAASDGENINIKLSTTTTADSITGKALEVFKKTVEEASDGRITCELYHSDVLGDYLSVFEMVQEGDVQMMTVNPLVYETQVTELATLDEYYMFDDAEHAHRFFEGEGGEFIHKAWNAIGVEGMTDFALGFRELTNNKRPVTSLEDLKGLTLRGYSTIQIAAWQAAGAAPTSVDWSELFVSMQQGLLDGQEAGLATINDYTFCEVQKYLTMTDHVFSVDTLLASSVWLETLSEEDETLIRDALKTAYEWHKEAYQEDEARLLESFEKDYGMEITYLDDATKEEFKNAMKPVTKEEVIKNCGQETYDTVQEYVEACR